MPDNNNTVTSINSALPQPQQFSDRNTTLGVFGGESFGFASSVESRYASTFYTNGAQPDGLTVPKGFKDSLPRAIFNKYALFNYRGLYGGLLGNTSNGYFDNGNRGSLSGENSAREISV